MPYGPATIPHLPPVWTGLYPYPKRSRTHWLIRHGAGTLDISVRYARGLRWLFPDGTTSTAARPSKAVSAGTTLVTCDDFAERGVEVEVHNNVATLTPEELPDLRWYLRLNNGTVCPGALINLPRVTDFLYLYSVTGLAGATSDLPRVQRTLYLYPSTTISGPAGDLPRATESLLLHTLPNVAGGFVDLPRVRVYCYLNTLGLTGDASELPPVTETLALYTLAGLTGDFKDLPRATATASLNTLANLIGLTSDVPPATTTLILNTLAGLTGDVGLLPANTGERRCISCAQVTGDLLVVATNTPIYFRTNAAVSAAEYDQTIANCVAAGGTNRTLYISSRRTAASDADKATLISRGWTVNDSTA